MQDIMITTQNVDPFFDMEEYMAFAGESRISGDAMQQLSQLWVDWLEKLNVAIIKQDNKSWLALWLPAEVEEYIDDAWRRSPGEGLMVNNLAQYLCMSGVREILPHTGDGGCAPAPVQDTALNEGLIKLGLKSEMQPQAALLRRYAVVTHFPFKGGCEICALAENCPRLKGQSSYGGITLRGHEKNTAE